MSDSKSWTEADIPDLSGKRAVVTGANSGLGFESARMLAAHGARVALACRDLNRAGSAVDRIRQAHPGAQVDPLVLDLADLGSVREFAAGYLQSGDPLHLLLNNAGVMALPHATTRDGFELQFGTNHLGHFALTGLVLERMLETPGARVVTVSSVTHFMGEIRFDDLNGEKSYRRWPAYSQSKLANLLFTLELQRRLQASGVEMLAVACHPGYAATNLQLTGPRLRGSRMVEGIMSFANRHIARSAAAGALPSVYAATAPSVRGGDYIGPPVARTGGSPEPARISARARNREDAARLWEISERLTGVRYRVLVSRPKTSE